jgi:hypothetical protein
MRNKFRTAVSSTGIPKSVGFTLFEKFLNLVIANNYPAVESVIRVGDPGHLPPNV